MRVELREVDAEAGRAQLDVGEIGRSRMFQPLRDVGRESQFEAGVEAYDDPIAATIVASRDRKRPGRAALGCTAGGDGEFIRLGRGSCIPQDNPKRFDLVSRMRCSAPLAARLALAI